VAEFGQKVKTLRCKDVLHRERIGWPISFVSQPLPSLARTILHLPSVLCRYVVFAEIFTSDSQRSFEKSGYSGGFWCDLPADASADIMTPLPAAFTDSPLPRHARWLQRLLHTG
jgi:hypothetical protein